MSTVVLVHGAWHGRWCWEGVVAALRQRGVEPEAVELPLTSFADDTAVARKAIKAAGPGVVVCGHSYGGMVISEAADGLPGVKRLVYLAAFMCEPGVNGLAVMGSDPSPLMSALVVDDRGLTVDPNRLHEVFYADSDPAVVPGLSERLRPMPASDSSARTRAAWKSVPSTYIVCTEDRAIMPSLQRSMAAKAQEVVEWNTDHSPFLTRPAQLADLLASYI